MAGLGHMSRHSPSGFGWHAARSVSYRKADAACLQAALCSLAWLCGLLAVDRGPRSQCASVACASAAEVTVEIGLDWLMSLTRLPASAYLPYMSMALGRFGY